MAFSVPFGKIINHRNFFQ